MCVCVSKDRIREVLEGHTKSNTRETYGKRVSLGRVSLSQDVVNITSLSEQSESGRRRIAKEPKEPLHTLTETSFYKTSHNKPLRNYSALFSHLSSLLDSCR